jgi:uncharacterized membrane protein
VIRPNQSLTLRQAIQVYAAIAIVCLGIGLAFALHGFWTVLPFAGLEILVLGAAFYLCLARSQVREVVSVNASVVTVEKGRQTPEERWECPRVWARVRLEQPHIAWYPSRLAIAFQGRQVELGTFLSEEERRALAAEMQQVIQRDDWQQGSPVRDNPAP